MWDEAGIRGPDIAVFVLTLSTEQWSCFSMVTIRAVGLLLVSEKIVSDLTKSDLGKQNTFLSAKNQRQVTALGKCCLNTKEQVEEMFLQRRIRRQITNWRTRYSSFRIDSTDRRMCSFIDVICKSSRPGDRIVSVW